MQLYISEIFNKCREMKAEADKIAFLKQHDCTPLKQILYANFSNKIKFLLPVGKTPYIPSKEVAVDISETNLFRETRRLYVFIEGGCNALRPEKRVQLWIELLESLHQDEAELLDSLKDKKLELKYGINRSIVEAAFPSLLSKETAEEVKPKQSSVPVSSQAVSEQATSEAPKKKRGRKPGTKNKAKEVVE